MIGQPKAEKTNRFVMHRAPARTQTSTFADDVRLGLTSSPKSLPSRYFYDELGSRLFEAICSLPEYYLTRAESAILGTQSAGIIQAIASGKDQVRLIELGSGSAEKTRYLIDALLARQKHLRYVPVDISAQSLERSSADLVHDYPQLEITACESEYYAALDWMAREGIPGGDGFVNVFLFLGSNIGNFEPEEAAEFLNRIRRVLRPGGALLLGADLKKETDKLISAYDDQLGVTSAFNRNMLVRINRELDADFDLSLFDHLAFYDQSRSRVEMHLVSREPQTVRIGALNLTVRFDWRESIHTENSYKFDIDGLSELAARAGFHLETSWQDPARTFSFNLMIAA